MTKPLLANTAFYLKIKWLVNLFHSNTRLNPT